MDVVLKDRITVADLIDVGACLDGVLEAMDHYEIHMASINVDVVLRLCVTGRERDVVLAASCRNGYGYGYYGSGYGDGNGYSYSYGYYGNSYGDGNGYGNSYGDGDRNNGVVFGYVGYFGCVDGDGSGFGDRRFTSDSEGSTGSRATK